MLVSSDKIMKSSGLQWTPLHSSPLQSYIFGVDLAERESTGVHMGLGRDRQALLNSKIEPEQNYMQHSAMTLLGKLL